MVVKRIVSTVGTGSIAELRAFYADLFGLEAVMDHGWFMTLASGEAQPVQIGLAAEGGSGAPVPDLSIEVDDVEAAYARARRLGHAIVYDITDEPWGVRRFFIRDPAGTLLNILAHQG